MSSHNVAWRYIPPQQKILSTLIQIIGLKLKKELEDLL